MNFTLQNAKGLMEVTLSIPTVSSLIEFSNMTTVPSIPIDPPLEKCNYYIRKGHGSENETIVLFQENLYGGIPQNLLVNIIGWLVLMVLFSLLRRAAGNYGRLALVRKDDQDDTSKWTQLFFAPDDVTGLALSDSPDGPTFAATGNINRIVNHDIEAGSTFLAEDENDTSVVAAEEALKEDQHFFAWIIKIFTLSDEKILRKCGTDAVQYLRFQRHLITFVLIMMLLCICVILPINFQGDLQGGDADFGHTTISNLDGSAKWLWVHAIMTVLFFPVGILIMRRFSVALGIIDAEDLCDDNQTAGVSASTSGLPSYEANLGGTEQEDISGNKMDTGTHNKQLQHGGDLSANSRTLMISGIPSTYCTKEFLLRHFQEAYPNLYSCIKDIQPAYDVSKLLALDEKRQRARKARIYCEGQIARHGAGQQMCPHPCGIICMKFDDCCGECSTCCSKHTVDALTFYREEEARLIGEVEREKARVRTKSIGIAFVTFATREDAKKVATDHRLGHCGSCIFWACSLLPNWFFRSLRCCGRRPPTSSLSNLLEPGRWSVRYSPHPDDIYWENLSESQHLFVIKALFVNLFVFVLLFFFTSPAYILSQIQIILNFKQLGTSLHLSEKMNDFVPTLLLWTIAALLPILVAYTDWWMGHWRRSAENLWIMRKVFFYLLFMVLILPSIGLTTLKGLIENFLHDSPIMPMNSTNANNTLMWSCIFLPDNGAFFINYVVTSTLVGTALEFMRFSELFTYGLRMCFARSIAEYTSVRKANLYEFPFGFNYGWMLLIFALTAAYAVICPIITPFGLFYLIMKHGVDRYNLYYAYKRSKISKQIHATAFMTRGAVHYIGLPEQDYFGSQPQPSGKKVKINTSEDKNMSRLTPQQNTSSNIHAILPPPLKMQKYDIMGKQRCPVEEDIYEEIDDYRVEFKDPMNPDKSNKKSTYSFEPPDNCGSEDDEYESTSPNTLHDKKNDESTNGRFKRLVHKRHGNSSNCENLEGNFSAYEQIPKELLRDLKRSANFRHLNDGSKKQCNNGTNISSHASGKLLNGVQIKMSQLNLTRLSSLTGTYSMFSNESTESINTMGSVGTPTTIDSNNTSNGTHAIPDSKNVNKYDGSVPTIKKSESSSFSISSTSGNAATSPLVKSPQGEGEYENDGKITRDLRSVPNLASCLLQSNDDATPTEENPTTSCDSIELLNFADANEIQTETDPDVLEPSPTDKEPSSTSITTRAIIENKLNLQNSNLENATNHQPTRSDSSYTFQSYDCSSRSSTLSSTATNKGACKPLNKSLPQQLKAVNYKSSASKPSPLTTSGLLSKNGSQVKLIDLEDEDEESDYPIAYFNSTEDDLNDFSSLSGYESMEGGIHYESSVSSSIIKTQLPVLSSTNEAKCTSLQYKNPPLTNDSQRTIRCESRLSFANPHYLCPEVQDILEKRSGTTSEKKISQISNVFGERMLGIVRDDLSHENFAQALNSPAESLVSDYNDFHARLSHDLVELKSNTNQILSSESSTTNVKLPEGTDHSSNKYYQTVEEEDREEDTITDTSDVELLQLRPKPSKTIHTPSMTPQLGRKIRLHSNGYKSNRPLSTGSILSSNSSPTAVGSSSTNPGMATLRRRLPQQPIYDAGTLPSRRNELNLAAKNISNGQTTNRNQLKLLMYIVGGREIGQATLFKRPISMWKLDLTKTF